MSAYERTVRDELRCRTLMERSRALRQSDPEGMMISAALAVSIAEQMNPEHTLGRAALTDLQARALAELGNAYRVAGDLVSAEATLARALRHSGQGTGDPRLLAVIMDLNASLYIDQRRFSEAIWLLDGIYTIYQALGEQDQAGRTLISKGIAVGYSLDPNEALCLLSQGLLLIDAARDPKLVLAGVHSLLYFLVEDGRITEADHLFEISQPLYSSQAGSLDKLKARWLEGLIAANRGEDENAERILQEVRTGFAAAELPYDAALASLALAEVLLRTGRSHEVTVLVEELLTLFRSHCIRREAIGAFLLQRKAALPWPPKSASG
jgi:tetratricopeptide (TPR) repeat protein